MKILLCFLLFGLLFGNNIKSYGVIRSDNFFSSNYTMKVICIDNIKYLLIERTGVHISYGFMSPKYKLVDDKLIIETCKERR
jgi:hypothetical protein